MLDTIGKSLSSSQLRELERFGGKANKFGVNFTVCNSTGELFLLCDGGKFKSDAEQLIKAGLEALSKEGEGSCIETEAQVCRLGEHNQILASVLKSGSETVGAALLDTGYSIPDARYGNRESILGEMLGLFAEKFQAAAKAEEQIEMVSTELSQTYEELVLLHKLSTNMKVTEPDANFLQMACDNLTDIVSVEGIAIVLEKVVEDEKRLVLTAGSGLIDVNEHLAAILHSRLTEEINSGKEALLDSEVDSPLRYDWSENIRNIIAVPLCGKNKAESGFAGVPILQKDGKMETLEKGQNSSRTIGLMVAINRIDKPDFDSTDVKLFNSVANGCAVFIENGRLFNDLEELFIGLLKALTSSIDAKDPYTRGHSERVAFICRWIAVRLADEGLLEEEQIHKVYLAGLLHDIGKMGVDEAVLRKEGRLTKPEFDCIKKHPSIGAGIIGAIKQMRDIVPGVLSHHERADGKGYPHGLVGENMPQIAKIIGLADSFDAMTSKRSYRDAMTVEQALGEIKRGLGTQFDETVGRVFINSDVYRLWDIMQDGFSNAYGRSSFSEYGAVAVGSIIQ